MRYAMFRCGPEEEWAELDAATAEKAMNDIRAWPPSGRRRARFALAGKIRPGGEELDSASKAKAIRPGPDGPVMTDGPDGPVMTDGPYLEIKEVIGGFLVLETEDIDEAVAIASEWPTLWGSTSVEVRPVME